MAWTFLRKRYCDSSKFGSVAARVDSTVYAVGAFVKEASVAVDNERVYVCVIAGTSHSAPPAWVRTKGAKTTEGGGTVVWQECTGDAAMNGASANVPTWTTGPKANAISIGEIIKNDAGTFYFICDTAGTSGSGAEPAWDTTAGNTTTDNTVTWRSLGAVSGFSATWTAPHARISLAVVTNWLAVAETLYVGHQHASTRTTAITITFPGTWASPNFCYVVSNADVTPTLSSGASELTTGANVAIQFNGCFYMESSAEGGMLFANGAVGNSGGSITIGGLKCKMINVDFEFRNDTRNYTIGWYAGTTGDNSNVVEGDFISCRWKWIVSGGSSCAINFYGGKIRLQGGSLKSGSTVPLVGVFGSAGGKPQSVLIDGFDMSQLPATSNLMASSTAGGTIIVRNSKLPTTAATAAWSGSIVSGGAFTTEASRIELWNVDDGTDENIRLLIEDTYGSIKSETSIIKTSGANDGVRGYSYKMQSNTLAAYPMKVLRSPPLFKRAATGSALTPTVEIIHSGVGAEVSGHFMNDEVWLETMYQGTSGFPLALFDSDGPATALTPAADQTTSAVAWINSPATPKQESLDAASITPQEVGYLIATVCLAKASKTLYFNPVIDA